MTKQQKSNGIWISLAGLFVMICGFVASGSADIQETKSMAISNKEHINYVDAKFERTIIRMENKVDRILEKVK